VNKTEYAKYEAAVHAFMEREGIVNLSTGHDKCPECKVEFDDHDRCPKCDTHRNTWDEPSFSWQPCECCGAIAGDREYATGWNPTTGEIQEYSICTDCAYYAEYGRLDDTAMLEIERSPA
jgi:hypothetical protein